MNDPQVLVTSVDNPTGVWIDLTECCDSEDFDEKVLEVCAKNYTISDSNDIPKCFIKNGNLDPEVFRYAQLLEVDRTTVFAYSTISTDIAQFIIQNALTAWSATFDSRADFARDKVKCLPIINGLIHGLSDCIDYDKLATKLEDQYIFVDITFKTYVFLK